jgi:hypothetical protein
VDAAIEAEIPSTQPKGNAVTAALEPRSATCFKPLVRISAVLMSLDTCCKDTMLNSTIGMYEVGIFLPITVRGSKSTQACLSEQELGDHAEPCGRNIQKPDNQRSSPNLKKIWIFLSLKYLVVKQKNLHELHTHEDQPMVSQYITTKIISYAFAKEHSY